MSCKEISVKAIIGVDGKFLVFFRNNSPILPGGCIEDGESLEEALLRELEEETGLSKDNFIIKCPIYSETYKNKIYVYYIVELINKSLVDKIKLSKEHDKFELLSLEEVKQYKWLYDLLRLI